MSKELRGGYTTGACAAAGAKAAVLYMQGEYCQSVRIIALDGTPLDIPVKNVEETSNGVCAEIVKFSGDDPDITNGVSVFTTVKMTESGGIVYKAGEGIGHVTKAGLSVPVGEPSINPGPRKLIAQEIYKLFNKDTDEVSAVPLENVIEKCFDKVNCEVTISIPAGVELSKRTLNPILGVEGGISVIGTTGVLRPMSEEAFKNSLVPQIEVAKAAGFTSLVYVPGKIGERIAVKWGLPENAMIQTSNFMGHMLEAASEREIKEILLFGHIGKLAKVACGVFHTHNRVGDGRLETMAAYSAAEGMPAEGVKRILSANTTEDALPVIEEYGLQKVYNVIAERASIRAERFLFGKVKVGTVMVTLKGELLGMDENAKDICRSFGKEIKF